jgi:hypothetical protein
MWTPASGRPPRPDDLVELDVRRARGFFMSAQDLK